MLFIDWTKYASGVPGDTSFIYGFHFYEHAEATLQTCTRSKASRRSQRCFDCPQSFATTALHSSSAVAAWNTRSCDFTCHCPRRYSALRCSYTCCVAAARLAASLRLHLKLELEASSTVAAKLFKLQVQSQGSFDRP